MIEPTKDTTEVIQDWEINPDNFSLTQINLSTGLTNILKYLLPTAFAVFSVIFPDMAQAFETFYVNGGMALNTNMNFRLFDTKPRVSIFQRNDNDRDQQWDRSAGNRGGILLRNVTTGMCLNGHYLSNGAEMNTWPCNANDLDQNWILVGLGDGWMLIKRVGTNLCVDTPTRDNAGKLHLWECSSSNPNQRWKSSAAPPPVAPPPVVISEQKILLSIYQVWIVARKKENSFIPWFGDAGHAWIAIVRRDYTRVRSFRNGILQGEQDIYDRGEWQTDTTYGFWDKKPPLLINNDSDKSQTSTIINGGSISARGYAVRKATISTDLANLIKNKDYTQAGCSSYFLVGGTGDQCNCTDYATRLWYFLSNKNSSEDFRTRSITLALTVDALVDKINQKNRDSGSFVDGGFR